MLNYAQVKENLLGVIEELAESARDETRKSLSITRVKLDEEAFNLVILGQFKRGKSTFINALLGEEILPTAIVPLTSVVTILRYGAELKVEVHYLDGRRVEIGLPDLPDYITEKGNPRNHKAVNEVIIFYPSAYLKGGVRIIDTPGAGSVYRHNTEVAYNYLPHVDAGIFVTSVDPPLSESEHQFLRDVSGYVDKLFFVLNKIDLVSEEDRRESLEFTKRILEEDLGTGKVKMFPLSARWALQGKKSNSGSLLEKSLVPDFEGHLQEFLIHEKGRVFLKAVASNLMKFISDETISFQVEQEAIKLPLDELTTRINRFEEEIKVISKDAEHNQFLLKGHLEKITGRIDDEIGAFKKDHLPVLLAELEEEYEKRVRAGGGDLRRGLEQFVFGRIQAAFNEWRQHLTDKISSQLEGVHRDFATKTNETVERIVVLTSTIFQLNLKTFTSVETLSKKSEFYFLLKDDPVGLELVQLAATSALPQFLARKMILKNMRNTVAELVDRHCGRVRYDLIKRLTNTVKDFQRSLNEKIDLTLEGIRISFQKALSLKQSSTLEVEKNLGEITEKLAVITAVREKLTLLGTELNHD